MSNLSSRKFHAANIFIVPSTMKLYVADSQKFNPVNIFGFKVLFAKPSTLFFIKTLPWYTFCTGAMSRVIPLIF